MQKNISYDARYIEEYSEQVMDNEHHFQFV